MQKELLAVTELFNIAVNDFDTKKFTHHSRMFVVTELVVSGTQVYYKQCGSSMTFVPFNSLHLKRVTVFVYYKSLSLNYVWYRY